MEVKLVIALCATLFLACLLIGAVIFLVEFFSKGN
jgi:hypothetical protein